MKVCSDGHRWVQWNDYMDCPVCVEQDIVKELEAELEAKTTLITDLEERLRKLED